MYTLPSNTRLTLRRIEKPLRSLVQACIPAWRDDKLAVIITDRVEQSSYEEPLFTRFDLVRGSQEIVPKFNARRFYIAVAPEEAILRSHRYAPIGGDVIIYVHAFSALDETLEDLAVARDALLEGDLRAGHVIAKRALPHGFGLFEALVRHERRLLGRAT